jgi:hypothetical protein
MTSPEAMLNAGKRIAAIASGRAFTDSGDEHRQHGADPAAEETPDPETEPADSDKPPEPGRQDEGQQAG